MNFFKLPLWMKIAVPAALAVFLTFGILIATGVINFSRFSQELVVPDGVVIVPDVEGMNNTKAVEKIEKTNLLAVTAGNVESEYIPAGTIVYQSSMGGAYMTRSAQVMITVSSGKAVQEAIDGISTVPYLTWSTLEEAKEKLATAGLGEPEIEEVYDDNVAAGQIISQDPEAGEEVPEGTVIKLKVSLGPQARPIPSAEGLTQKEAEELLLSYGLSVTISYVKDDSYPEGQVISQSIAEGTEVHRGDSVVITVAAKEDTVEVPEVAGMSRKDAISAIESRGLKATVLENYDNNVPKGTVIGQTPGAGTSLKPGDNVTLYVSKGPEETAANETQAATPAPTAAPTTAAPTEGTTRAAAETTAAPTTAAPTSAPSTTAAPTKTEASKQENTTAAPTVESTKQESTTAAQAVLDSISVRTNPAKTNYFVGDTLNTDGLTLTASYSDRTTEIISSGFSCSPMTLDRAGREAITVSYGGKSTSFTVQVTAVSAIGISIATLPTKTQYFIGDSLDLTGLTLNLHYNNGTTEIITDLFGAGADLDKQGTEEVIVKYGSFQTTYTVRVDSPEISGLPASMTLAAGCQKTLSVSTYPSGQPVSWSSSNTNAVTVDASGRIKAVSASGSATVTASFNYNGRSYSRSITVNTAAGGISISQSSGAQNTDIQQNLYTIGSAPAWLICSIPSVSVTQANADYGDTGFSQGNVSVSWSCNGVTNTGGSFYGTAIGSFTQTANVYYNGVYIGSKNFTTSLALTMTSYSGGNYIRADHSTSSASLGSIPGGLSGIPIAAFWLDGVPQAGTKCWGKVNYNGVVGWAQIYTYN